MNAEHSRTLWALVAGLVTGAMALVGLERWSETSFTAHMAQHVLLIVVTAPLLAAGAPFLLERLPDRWGRMAASIRGRSWVAWAGVAVFLQAAAMVLWHLPGAFQSAVASDPLHALEHVTLVATAVLFWWVVLGAGPARMVMGIVALFFATVACSGMGAALALAGHTWYPAYRSLDDQAMGGVVMWSVAGTAYLIAAVGLFFAWLAGLERTSPGRLVTSP
jgi:putative membrane protein